MKKTTSSYICFALQIVFMIILPVIFVCVQYTSTGDASTTNATTKNLVKFKLSVSAIALLILMFAIFKKVFINSRLKMIDTKITNIDTQALTITDEKAIKANKKAYRFYSVIQFAINIIIPILVMILFIIIVQAVERDIIKLYGCLIFSCISFCVGCVFRVGEIYSMRSTHEGTENKQTNNNDSE